MATLAMFFGIIIKMNKEGRAPWAKLKSPAFFRQVRAECGTLCWPEDIDVAPESVWEDASRAQV